MTAHFLHGAVDLPDAVRAALVDLLARGVGVGALQPVHLIQDGIGHILEAELAYPKLGLLGAGEATGE
jgi:hypothetical protein